MIKLILVIIFLSISSNAFSEVIGEVVNIRETASGIINVEIEYKNDDKSLEIKSYVIADSSTAITEFQNNVLPSELLKVKTKNLNGEYDIEEKKTKLPKKDYSIKIGDKIIGLN